MLFLSWTSAHHPWHWVPASCWDDGTHTSPLCLSFRRECQNPGSRMDISYPQLSYDANHLHLNPVIDCTSTLAIFRSRKSF
jgi:hypothetical protein